MGVCVKPEAKNIETPSYRESQNKQANSSLGSEYVKKFGSSGISAESGIEIIDGRVYRYGKPLEDSWAGDHTRKLPYPGLCADKAQALFVVREDEPREKAQDPSSNLNQPENKDTVAQKKKSSFLDPNPAKPYKIDKKELLRERDNSVGNISNRSGKSGKVDRIRQSLMEEAK